MSRNLFVNLLKYKPVDNRTPLENFITEAFVFLLDWSLVSDRNFITGFFKLLEIPSVTNINYSEVEILTQKTYKTNNNSTVIPDISIRIKDTYYFIEVKVLAQFNIYSDKNDTTINTINQIEMYDRIVVPSREKFIYSLTIGTPSKNELLGSTFKKSITWTDIYALIEEQMNTCTKMEKNLSDFRGLLINMNMVPNKVTDGLKQGIVELISFFNQLGIVIDNLDYKKNQSNSIGFLGFYIIINPGIRLWVGINFNYSDYVKIQVVNKDLVAELTQNHKYTIDPVNSECILVSIYEFESKNYFSLTGIEQCESLTTWLQQEINALTEYVLSLGESFKMKEDSGFSDR